MFCLPFLIFCFVFPPTATPSSNQTDLESLLAFKSGLKDPHGSLNSWNQTTHFCNWRGIRCGGRHPDRVVRINLRSQGLVGTISPHVGNLSFLRRIVLQNNSFHGPIPQQISLLRRLELVEFSNNSLVGEIPRNLSRCPNLVYLNLFDNKLTGAIPPELGFLSKLEALGLSENKLSGPIPSFLGNITSLRTLSLLSCSLGGEIPHSLAQLQSLTFLQLSDNALTGTIPSSLFNMTAIQFFSVSRNKLQGVLPSNIGLTLANLKHLYLWRNQFSGPIPVSISNATLLENMNFNENYLTGPMPKVGRLTHLQDFIFGSNLIADDVGFISSLTNSSKLQFFSVSENLLTGSLPESIANLSRQLLSLYLGNNKIYGKVPASIGNLVGLTWIFLSGNLLEGPIPSDITKLSNLRDLYMETNRFTNEIPPSFGNLTFLSRLFLNENYLSGNIPSSLGNCTHLLELDLSRNNFNGLIPREIMSLPSVSIIFNLSHNGFTGSIPYEVGSLTNLGTLDLSNNKLTGSIPSSLAKCISVEQLFLEGNLLEGEIPIGISALMGLQYLDLSRNKLSGPIPNFLGELRLKSLNLSFNRLQGEVPTTGVFRNKTSIALDGNNELCGGMWELKLRPCASKKKNSSTLLKILIPILVAGGMCLVLSVCFVKFAYRRRSRRNETSSLSSSIGVQFIRLSYIDLLKATGGLSEANLLGVGRFGSVYKGMLDDGHTHVAVKVLNLFVRGASKSFMAECNALRDARHRNLVKILSVCESMDLQGNDFKALVYEFKANGSLEKWLYNIGEEEKGSGEELINLSMIQRLNIAIDIAQALEYLHCGTGATIVHGDLKPSNILLDHEMTACVGDFGLAKIVSEVVPSHESSSSIGIRGTIGYVPPEYGMSHSVSTQGDAYSYGIVLLEMFTNKTPIDDLFKDNLNLHKFVSAALPDHVMEIVDPLLQTQLDVNNSKIKNCMTSILSTGVQCSKEIPEDRLSITDVINELRKIQKLLSS